MKVSADSDNEVDIEPYWTTIKVNELHGLGNPMEITTLNDANKGSTNSMPDLVSVSDSEESIIFVLSDEEMADLVEDGGEEGLTTFNTAMLVNIGGNVEGVLTELYDSGASCHMSPYHEHFENYVSIMPKLITAADKCYF